MKCSPEKRATCVQLAASGHLEFLVVELKFVYFPSLLFHYDALQPNWTHLFVINTAFNVINHLTN